MSGGAPAGNYTSTTGPMTWVILPLCAFVEVAMSTFPESYLSASAPLTISISSFVT